MPECATNTCPETGPDAPFDEPWQAQLFALTVALSERGAFTWPDWTRALGAELATGAEYWPAWLRALETLLAARGLAQPQALHALAHRWRAAARATPHGQPIRLENAG